MKRLYIDIGPLYALYVKSDNKHEETADALASYNREATKNSLKKLEKQIGDRGNEGDKEVEEAKIICPSFVLLELHNLLVYLKQDKATEVIQRILHYPKLYKVVPPKEENAAAALDFMKLSGYEVNLMDGVLASMVDSNGGQLFTFDTPSFAQMGVDLYPFKSDM